MTTRTREHAFAALYLVAVLAVAVGGGLLPGQSLTMAHELAVSDEAFEGDPAATPLPPEAHVPIRPNDPAPIWFAYPTDVLAARLFHAGEWPTWNPYNGFGAPLLAAGETAPFFPLKLLYYLAPPVPSATMQAYSWYLASRLLVAGLGTYAFARLVGFTLAGALVASQGFMLSGYLLTDFQHVDSTPVTLLPLVAWTIEAVVRSVPGAWGACGLALGIMVLSGHPESALFASLGSALYALARLVAIARRDWRDARDVLVRLSGAAVIGLGVSCVGALPLIELMRTRPSYVSAGSTATFSLHAAAERYWALAAGYSLWPLIDLQHPLRPSVYFLIVNPFAGPLAVWGACMRWSGAAKRMPVPVWAFAAVAGGAAVLLPPLALLPSPLRIQSYYSTPLLSFTLALVAGWGVEQLAVVRAGHRPGAALAASIVSVLWIAALAHAAFGAAAVAVSLWWMARSPFVRWAAQRGRLVINRRDGFLTSPATTQAGVVSLVIGAALLAIPITSLTAQPLASLVWGFLLALQSHLGPTPSRSVLPTLVALVWSVATFVVLGAPPRLRAQLGGAVASLAVVLTGAVGIAATHRIMPALPAMGYPDTPRVTRIRSESTGYRFAALATDLLRGNTSTVYGIHDIRLTYVFHSCRYRLFLGTLNGGDPRAPCAAEQFSNNLSAQRAAVPLLRAASVRLAAVGDDAAGTVAVPGDWTPRWRMGDVAFFELPEAVPRAYWVATARHCPAGGRGALIALANEETDLTRVVLLENGTGDASRLATQDAVAPCGVAASEVESSRNESTAVAIPAGVVRVLEHTATRVRLESAATVDGYLVLTEAASPGWSATVGGREAVLHTANFAFRAVAVAAGTHRVDFRYEAPGFAPGLAATTASLLVNAGGIVAEARRRTLRSANTSSAALVLSGLLTVALAVTLAGFAPHPAF